MYFIDSPPYPGCLFCKKIILTTPLLHWYLKHGLVVSHVYKVVDYGPKPCFRGFGDYVSDARRQGDVDPDRAITADTMKLLRNSGYCKTVTNVERHHNLSFCNDVAAARGINSHRFRQLDQISESLYQITSSKSIIRYGLPIQIE